MNKFKFLKTQQTDDFNNADEDLNDTEKEEENEKLNDESNEGKSKNIASAVTYYGYDISKSNPALFQNLILVPLIQTT